jgi:hypothetical protein
VMDGVIGARLLAALRQSIETLSGLL